MSKFETNSESEARRIINLLIERGPKNGVAALLASEWPEAIREGAFETIVKALCEHNSTWKSQFKMRVSRRTKCPPDLRRRLEQAIKDLEGIALKRAKLTTGDVFRRARASRASGVLEINDARQLGLGPEHRPLLASLHDLAKRSPVALTIKLNCDHVYVHGLAIIAAWTARFAATVRIEASHPRVAHYIENTGFRRIVEEIVTINAPFYDGQHYVALTSIEREATQAADGVAKRLVDLFERLLQLSREQRNALGVMFAELVENVYRHAQSNFPAYVMAQAFPETRKLHVIVVDTGIGVFNSFRNSESKTIREQATNERRSIELSLERRVTSKMKDHAGYGLYVVRRLVEINQGRMRLMSGRTTKRIWTKTSPILGSRIKQEVADNLAWQGTEVSLMFDLSRELPLNTVYSELGPIEGYEDEDFFD